MKLIFRLLSLLMLLGSVFLPTMASADGISVSCHLTNNQVWNIDGTIDDAAPTISMYRGSTYVQRYNSQNGTASLNGTQFAAQTTEQDYTVYNGPDSTAAFLTTISCPAKQAAATPAPAPTSTPKPTTTTTTPAQPAPVTTDQTPAATSDTDTDTDSVNVAPEASGSGQTSTTESFNSAAASTDQSTNKGLLIAVLLISGLIIVYLFVINYIVFKKAGKPGWASFVPVYNTWVLYEMGGKPGWWAVLLFVPFVNIVAIVILIGAYIEIARRFGKSALFGVVGLLLFSVIGFTILAFGKARYSDPGAAVAPAVGQPLPPAPQV